MSNLTSRIIQIILWLFMAVTIVFAAIFYFGNVIEGTKGTRLEEPVVTQAFLSWAYILFFIAAGITVIFSIINIILNPKGIKKGIIYLVVAAAVIIIAYFMADDTVLNMPHYTGKDNVPTTLRYVDTVLFTAYILVGLAFLAILWSSVSRIFK
ncbi:MAG TPA: hypothetical protein DEQ09_10495 [Bacteroidales bacterium]|nr:hypothetical protein [Bacteroidales bacterium]